MIGTSLYRWSLYTFFLFIFLTLTSSSAEGQNDHFRHISQEYNQPNFIPTHILQDRTGFIWISTRRQGLKRFDGNEFRSFKYDPLDTTSVSNNRTLSLTEDKNGILWIGTRNGGLNGLDPMTERCIRYEHDPANPGGISYSQVGENIAFDQKGKLWIPTNGRGLNCFDPVTGKFQVFVHKEGDGQSLKSNTIRRLWIDSRDRVWIGYYQDGIDVYDPISDRYSRVEAQPEKPDGLLPGWINDVWEDRQGNIWVSNYFGISILDPDSFKAIRRLQHQPNNPNSLSNNNVVDIIQMDDKTLWIGTSNGLNIYDPQTGQFQRFYHDPEDEYSLSSSKIYCLYRDRSGVLWIGTEKGVDIIDPKVFKVQHYLPDSGSIIGHGTVVRMAQGKDSILWIPDYNGLNKVSPQYQLIKRYRHEPGNPNSLASKEITCIFEDKASGHLWIGTTWGLSRMDLKTETFKNFYHNPDDPSSLSNYFILNIEKDNKGQLWVSTYRGGLHRFIPHNSTWKRYRHDPDNPDNPKNPGHERIYVLKKDRQGRFWLGTGGGGLDLFDPETESFRHFRPDPSKGNSLSYGVVYAILEDSNGVLWLGTAGGGLNRFDPVTETFTVWTEQNSNLPDNSIYSILEDDNGDIWLSSSGHISRFDQENNTFQNFDHHNGIQTISFCEDCALKTLSGDLLFGSNDYGGLYRFHPDSIKLSDYLAPVVFTGLNVSGKPVKIGKKGLIDPNGKTISAVNKIRLLHTENDFMLSIASLDFLTPEQNQLHYQLIPFHDDWMDPGRQRSVGFTNLDPGNYTLRLKGTNRDGIWNPKEVQLQIQILPPWWKTNLAYLFYSFLALGVLFLIYRIFLNRERMRHRLAFQEAEAENLRRLDDMKSRFFSNVSHEFRTPLTLILAPIERILGNEKGTGKELLQVSTKEAKLIQRNAHQLLRLINQLLDLSKLESRKMELQIEEVDLGAFLGAISGNFHSLVQQNNIQFYSDINVSQKGWLDPHKVEDILNNLLSNAFKFTPVKGSVHFSAQLSPTGKSLHISIKDTGIGIAPENIEKIFQRFEQLDQKKKLSTGIGLALVKELIDLHHGAIVVQSKTGKGTEFKLTIPCIKEAYQHSELATIIKFAPPKTYTSNLSTESKEQLAHSDRIEKPLLLIVEDHADLRAFIVEALEQEYRILEGKNGQEGYSIAIEQVPDLIISDIMMPEMGGTELCLKLKTNLPTSHIPIILLTAKAGMESKLEGLETGADAYLTKPFNDEELKVRIRNLISQREQLRQQFSQQIAQLEPEKMNIRSIDQQFLTDVKSVLKEHRSNTDFSVDTFLKAIGMSRTQLHRKLKDLTGMSATELIRDYRLKYAANLLKQNFGNITDVAYESGFGSPAHFSEKFKEKYGCTPSEYLKNN